MTTGGRAGRCALLVLLCSSTGWALSPDAGMQHDASAPWLPPIPTVDESLAAQWQQKAQRLPGLAARIQFISRHLRYLPYGHSPLGEGPGAAPDADPRFRLDRFDCTTFVETVLALSLTPELHKARRQLDHIRYSDGQIDFSHRRHLPMAQWIPGLIKQGLVVDVTRRIAGDKTLWAHKKLDDALWRQRKKTILPELQELPVAAGVYSLPVIAVEDALTIEDQIPGGLILSVVRADFAHLPIRVTHQGLLIHRGGTLYIRHAIGKKVGRVIDERFEHFARRNAGYQKWPVTGFNLLRPVAYSTNERRVRR